MRNTHAVAIRIAYDSYEFTQLLNIEQIYYFSIQQRL